MALFEIISTPIEVDYQGKLYKLSPLSLKQYARYCFMYKYKELEELLGVRDMLSTQLFEEKRREVYEKCSKKGWMYFDSNSGDEKFAEFSFECPEIRQSLLTDWGTEKQLLLSIQIEHPEVDSNLLAKIIPMHKWGEILLQFLQINGLLRNQEEEDENDPLETENLNQ